MCITNDNEMQYKTVSVCMLNIKLIQFNSSFKSSYHAIKST